MLANALTWGLWEPWLFVVFLLVGRVWCTVCPLSTAGRLAARIKNFGVAPGAWLKEYSGWFIERPRAAGYLLVALFTAASVSAMIWRRESWCRYLCPLGNLGAIFSLPAVLTVRSNPSVCPHGSARLYLRLPFQSVWAQPDVGSALVPFALFLFFFAPAMLASQGGRGSPHNSAS